MSGAYDEAVRLLASRSLTRREVEDRLRARGHAKSAIDDALTRLAAIAAIDDRALAQNWIATSAARRGRGRDRVLAELAARGVDEEIASRAWSMAVEDGAIEPAALLVRAVSRRLGANPTPTGKGRLARVYNALLFEGFAPSEVEAALVPYGFERNEEE